MSSGAGAKGCPSGYKGGVRDRRISVRVARTLRPRMGAARPTMWNDGWGGLSMAFGRGIPTERKPAKPSIGKPNGDGLPVDHRT